MPLQLGLDQRACLTLEQSWVEIVSGRAKTQRAVLKLSTEDTRELVRFLADYYPAAEQEYARISVFDAARRAELETKKAEVAALEAELR